MRICKFCKTVASQTNWILRAGKLVGNTCKSCHAENCRKYYHANADYASRVKASTKKQRLTAERKALDCRAAKGWALANVERVKVYAKLTGASRAAKHRVIVLQRTPVWLTNEECLQVKSMYALAQIMSACTGETYHVDHIVPLQGKTVSGLHTPYNLQVILATENLSKGNKHV